MFTPTCPHRWSKRLNKLLPPDIDPYDHRISSICVVAGFCDMSEECGIRECGFFSIDPKDEELAQSVQLKFFSGELSEEEHDKQMKEIHQREVAKGLYEKYGDRYVCNEPLLSAKRMAYAVENDLLDITVQDDGSIRRSLNTAKVQRHDMNAIIEANQKMTDDKKDED